MDVIIRPAILADLPALSQIEHSSDQLLLTCGKSVISNLPANPPEVYRSIVEAGHVWVASPSEALNGDASFTNEVEEHAASAPVAFISVNIIENRKHAEEASDDVFKTLFIHQVSVDPRFGRKGIGKKLMQHVEVIAIANAFEAIDLTTFPDVPFNKPYYEKLGYRELSSDDLLQPDAQGVWEVLAKERKDEILGRWERTAMRKML